MITISGSDEITKKAQMDLLLDVAASQHLLLQKFAAIEAGQLNKDYGQVLTRFTEEKSEVRAALVTYLNASYGDLPDFFPSEEPVKKLSLLQRLIRHLSGK